MFTKAIADVLKERERQIKELGYDAAHDDKYERNELFAAAMSYAFYGEDDGFPALWPWPEEYWNPKDERRNLIRSIALLIAEVERMDRQADGHGHKEAIKDAFERDMSNGY